MAQQKRMIASTSRLWPRAGESGRKVVYTFVPGNLTELLCSFDTLPVLPEIQCPCRAACASFRCDYVREARTHRAIPKMSAPTSSATSA
jgi:hypothetical protein